MTDDGSTIRVNQPFSNAKHWVCGAADAYTFTDNPPDAAGIRTNVVRICDALQRAQPSASIAVKD
jgi:hypothetical protein